MTFTKNSVPWNKGKKGLQHHTEDFKIKAKGRMIGKKYRLGMSPWNTGKKLPSLSSDHKQKISTALKGIMPMYPVSFTGKKHTLESKKKIGLAHLGKKRPLFTEITRQKMSSARVGKKLPPELIGKNHWNWKGGKSPYRTSFWHSLEHKAWRKAVFVRDDYTCKMCGQKGGKIEAHHIKTFKDYPELRLVVGNGITLCKKYHRSIKGKEKNYVIQFYKLISK